MVTCQARAPVERAAGQLQRHERLWRRVVLAGQSRQMRESEAEAGIVVRMAEHHDQADTQLAAPGETGLDEGRAHPPSLLYRVDRHRSQPEGGERRLAAIDRDG